MAAEIQTVDHIEYAEEQWLYPRNLLIPEPHVERTFVEFQEKCGKVDLVIPAVPLQRVRVALTLHGILEIVRPPVHSARIAGAGGLSLATDAIGIGLVVPAGITQNTHRCLRGKFAANVPNPAASATQH